MKPFLKYPGGKSRLTRAILPHLVRDAQTILVEPFCGSGAVSLAAMGDDLFHSYCLMDTNADVISIFQILASANANILIEMAQNLFADYPDTPENYYSLREIFNNLRWSDSNNPRPITRAAYFVWLNRHCFNGIVRYSRSGSFNVPHGSRANPPVCPDTLMRTFADACKTKRVFVNQGSFEIRLQGLLDSPSNNYAVYCDPPYLAQEVGASARNAPVFNSYDAGRFTPAQHETLAELCRELGNKGITCVVSNHDSEATRSLYADATIVSFDVHRTVSGQPEYRRTARELLAIYGPTQNLQQAA